MISFFRQTCQRFQTTGAIAPSSQWLGKALTTPLTQAIAHQAPPLRILEAGPGTGPITHEILAHLRPQDTLTLAELNPAFVQHLRARLQGPDPRWNSRINQVRIFEGPVQTLNPEAPYDFIICGLPFTNFPAELVDDIFCAFHRFSRPGTILTYFEYIGLRRLRQMISAPRQRQRLIEINRTINAHHHRTLCRVTRSKVLLNIPPAWVHRMELAGADSNSSRWPSHVD